VGKGSKIWESDDCCGELSGPAMERRAFLGAMTGVAAVGALASLEAQAVAQTAGGEELFDIKKVADGVYGAVAAPAFKVNSNTAIIELNDSLVVVDTHSKPSAARVILESSRRSPASRFATWSTRTSTGITGRGTRSIRAPRS
jgi:hypothetical protein